MFKVDRDSGIIYLNIQSWLMFVPNMIVAEIYIYRTQQHSSPFSVLQSDVLSASSSSSNTDEDYGDKDNGDDDIAYEHEQDGSITAMTKL